MDPTGRDPFMGIEKQRVSEKGADFKEEQRLFSTVEKPAVEREHTAVLTINIGRQKLALIIMVIFTTNKFYINKR